MKFLKKYNKIKILAAVLLAASGFYCAFTKPGIMDSVNGIIHGLVFYGLFVAEDPKPEKQEE